MNEASGLSLSSSEDFIKSFISVESNKQSYEFLLNAQELFNEHFSKASDEQKKLFGIYVLSSAAGKDPNLYKRLSLLENSLIELDLAIEKDSNSYDFRVARITIHSNLPIYFRNNKLIDKDLTYLVEGYNKKTKFKFLNGFRELHGSDFFYISEPLKHFNLYEKIFTNK